MTSSIVENLCDTKYPYRSTPILIQNEEQTIGTGIPYSISLLEKPSLEHPVTISGYTERDYAPSVATDFYIDYDASVIYFFSTEAGKNVLVTFYGTGSPIIAGDVNRFSLFFDGLHSVLFSFLVEALSGCRVRIHGGKFVDSVTGDTINTKKELFMDFGPNGNYQLSNISTGYSKKLLIGIDIFTLQIVVVEGTEASKYDAALIPSYDSTFRPVAIITVTENKDSILDIVQSDIIVMRELLAEQYEPENTTKLVVTGEIAANTNFSVTSSGVSYTKSGDSGDLLATSVLFQKAEYIRIFLNGVYMIKGVQVTWQSQTSFQLDIVVDNGDEIIILS